MRTRMEQTVTTCDRCGKDVGKYNLTHPIVVLITDLFPTYAGLMEANHTLFMSRELCLKCQMELCRRVRKTLDAFMNEKKGGLNDQERNDNNSGEG